MNWCITLQIVLMVFSTSQQWFVFSRTEDEVTLSPPINCKLALCAIPDCPNPITPKGQCCPVCVPDCSLVLCAAPDCENSFTPPGQCCPICPDCSAVLCPRPLCANPKVKPGDCCPTCEDSNCKFEGCVNFFSNGGVRWSPSPCFICQCNEELNQKICAIIDCFFPTQEDCFGYPIITKPNECCPRCDFGVPDDTCRVVPQIFGEQNITVTTTPGSKSCSKRIIRRTCDKLGFRSQGRKFRCDQVEGSRALRFDKNCPLNIATYTDVIRCNIIQDDSVNVGCDLIVDETNEQPNLTN